MLRTGAGRYHGTWLTRVDSRQSSFHPSGTNFLAADGSVRLVPETIEKSAYLALCTRAAGDLIGDSAAP